MGKKGQNIFAAIHLGSEKISLKVVEYRSFENINTLDFAERRVRIGEETFKTGEVSLPMIKELCEMLNNYKRMMKEYNVGKCIVIGTTAMREARNRAFMIDQIYMSTGLEVDVIDMPLEIYYKYISIAKTLKDAKMAADGASTLYADISSGGLGITLVENKEIKYQQNIHIGVIRVKESFDKHQRASNTFNSALTEYLSSIVSPVHKHLENYNIKRMVLTGTNTSLLLRMLGIKESNKVIVIPTKKFTSLYNRVIDMKLAKIMKEFDLSENVAEIALPTIIFYQQLITLSEVPELVFPPDRFIDSLVLLYIAKEKQHDWLKELDEELISFVHNIAKHYEYDAAHAKRVAAFSLLIFERIKKIHGLDERCRLLLHVAAILHDIGKFVNLRQHYFFSYRLILSTDIFGLSEDEKRIAAYAVYHHAKDFFGAVNEGMLPITRRELSVVAKLAAILRLSDALDRSYKQKINNCKIALKNDEMQIIVTSAQDLSLERWTVEDKISLFGDVFGIKPVLIEKNA